MSSISTPIPCDVSSFCFCCLFFHYFFWSSYEHNNPRRQPYRLEKRGERWIGCLIEIARSTVAVPSQHFVWQRLLPPTRMKINTSWMFYYEPIVHHHPHPDPHPHHPHQYHHHKENASEMCTSRRRRSSRCYRRHHWSRSSSSCCCYRWSRSMSMRTKQELLLVLLLYLE